MYNKLFIISEESIKVRNPISNTSNTSNTSDIGENIQEQNVNILNYNLYSSSTF